MSTQSLSRSKRYISEQTLLEDAYRLAVSIYDSGFRPDFIAGVWRGGSVVGIYVQECLQTLGVKTDHIGIRTSYEGMLDYHDKLERDDQIRAHGLQYLYETLEAEHRMLIVDDVYSTGRHIDAVIQRLQKKTRLNMPADVRIAAPYWRQTEGREPLRQPDFYLEKTDDWLVLPYELTGLSRAEIRDNKPWVAEILDRVQG